MRRVARTTLATRQQQGTNSSRLQAIHSHFRRPASQYSSPDISRMTEEAYNSGTEFPPLKPGLMRFYSMRFCPWAQRTKLILEHKQIPYETVNINLKDKPSWFLEKNPLGLVPVLELDDKIVYESTATCDWLDDIYPANRLQPSDPYRRAWDRIVAEYYGKLAGTVYKLSINPKDNEDVISELEKHYKFFENVLRERKGPFFGDDKPALVDFLIWPHFERLLLKAEADPTVAINKEKFPRLEAWSRAVAALPAAKATAFDAKIHLQFFESMKSGNPDYNVGLQKKSAD